MSLNIKNIQSGSLADKAGLQAGDKIITINNNKVNDYLDLQFHSADELIKIDYFDKNGDSKNLIIEQNWEIPLGIEPSEHNCRNCINNCVFCFVDQMKKGLRKSLYIKDDDYRLSFTFGNFITLTNHTDRDFKRILEQKLSPLYISVHTTNPHLHKELLRYKIDFNIMEKLQFLSDNGIEFHAQIVIIPGLNDGIELERSLEDLTQENLNSLSIGIVPVGLTKFRKSLNDVQSVDSKLACKLLELTNKYPKTYCSDEIYILAEKQIPSENFYDGYPQLENGIGMLRLFLENFEQNKNDFLSEISKLSEDLVFISGKLSFQFISKIVEDVSVQSINSIRVIAIINEFFGSSVTVTGLLSATDIMDQVKLQDNEIPVLSKAMFNENNQTIDDLSLQYLLEHFSNKILIIDEDFGSWEFIDASD